MNTKKTTTIIKSIKRPLRHIRRIVFESIGVDTYSKPYPNHARLLSYINRKNGFFIEVGGNDGIETDPTYYLERFLGWRGVILEPLPNMARSCGINRKRSKVVNVAAVSSHYQLKKITIVECAAQSVIKNSFAGVDKWIEATKENPRVTTEEIEVPTMTLDDIIDRYAYGEKIDLLVVDVEGYELHVLHGLDLDRHRPEYLLIEIHTDVPAMDQKTELEKYFGDRYALIASLGHCDYLYKRTS